LEGRKRNEKRALQAVGVCFLALAIYIAYESTMDLWSRRAAEPSTAGIILACVSLLVMPLLSRAKRNVGHALGSAAMHADAKQTQFCTYLSHSSRRIDFERGLRMVVGRPDRGADYGSPRRERRNRRRERESPR